MTKRISGGVISLLVALVVTLGIWLLYEKFATVESVPPVVPEEEIVENPEVKPVEVVEPVETEKVVSVYDLIEEYYEKISDEDLEGAYAMKYEPEVSFKVFEGWYGNTEYAQPIFDLPVQNDQYKFHVDLKDKNGAGESYLVVMEMKDGLLDTISSVKIPDAESDLTVFTGDFSLFLDFPTDLEVIKPGESVYKIYAPAKVGDGFMNIQYNSLSKIYPNNYMPFGADPVGNQMIAGRSFYKYYTESVKDYPGVEKTGVPYTVYAINSGEGSFEIDIYGNQTVTKYFDDILLNAKAL